MTMPLIQSALLFAHRREFSDTPTDAGYGVAFAATLLPALHDCDAVSGGTTATTLSDNMKLDASSTSFAAVKAALEANLDCLSIPCSKVGGLWDAASGGYYPGAYPCGTYFPVCLTNQEGAQCKTCGPNSYYDGSLCSSCPSGSNKSSTSEATTCGGCKYEGCEPCPANAEPQGLASISASTSLKTCVCKPGYYDAAGERNEAECEICKGGTDCKADVKGITLATLPLLPGYFRSSPLSDDLRRCPDFGEGSGCVGGLSGAGEGPCKENLKGPYCTLCNVTDASSFYYDSSKSECLVCEGRDATETWIVLASAVGGVLLLLMLALPVCATRLRSIVAVVRRCGLGAKGKQLISSWQMATSIQSAFLVILPNESVRAVLTILELASLNLFDFGLPIECLGLGRFLDRLHFAMVSPIVLGAAALPVAALRLRFAGAECTMRALLLGALPMALRLLFVVFTLVSAVAVQV